MEKNIYFFYLCNNQEHALQDTQIEVKKVLRKKIKLNN